MIRVIITCFLLITTLCNATAGPRQMPSLTDGDPASYENGVMPDNPEVLRTAAIKFINLGDYDRAIDYGHRLVEIGQQTGDSNFSELYGHAIVGHAAVMQGQPMLGFLNLQQALTIARQISDNKALTGIYNSLGIYYLKCLNDPYSAISNFYSAIDYARLTGDRHTYAGVLSNIAEAYLMRNDPEGISIAEEAFETARRRNDESGLFHSSYVLARFYMMKDSLDAAQEKINICERLVSKSGIEGRPEVAMLRTEHSDRIGDLRLALDFCNEALSAVDSGVTSPLANEIRLTHARLLRKSGKPEEAIQVLFRAMGKASQSRTEAFIPEMLKEASLAFRDANTPTAALEFAHIYEQYQDSVFSLSRERALQEARIKNDIISKEQEIDRQKIQLLSNRNKMILLGAGLVIVFVLLVTAIYNQRKKDKLYTAIVSQNSEYLNRETMLLDSLEKARHALAEAQAQTQVPENAPQPEVQPVTDTSSPTTTISTDKLKDLMERFTQLMLEKKLFTDPNLTVASVAESLSTNRTYLSKAINESTGNTFTQIVNDYRIREAIRLISDIRSNIPLKQIAYDVGFNSMSTFYVTFQAITGMTPARYRSKTRSA